jgi:hypothetical protein
MTKVNNDNISTFAPSTTDLKLKPAPPERSLLLRVLNGRIFFSQLTGIVHCSFVFFPTPFQNHFARLEYNVGVDDETRRERAGRG